MAACRAGRFTSAAAEG